MSTPEQPEHENSEPSIDTETRENSESKGSGTLDPRIEDGLHSEELEKLRADFVYAEKRRRRRALLGGVLVLVSFVAFVALMVKYSDTGFRPEVEKGEQNVLSETNDPVCRGMIEQVTAVGVMFFEQEAFIENGLVSDDRAEVLRVQAFLEEQRAELEKIAKRSRGAVFRYKDSRRELNQWVEFVDTEYGQLIRLADERATKLGLTEDVAQSAADKKAEAASLELQRRALLAVHESFHSFRVWHTSSLHPCGSSATELIPEG